MSTFTNNQTLNVTTADLKDNSTTSAAEVSATPSPVVERGESFKHTENQLNMITENAKYAAQYQETYKDGHLPLPPSKQYLVLTCEFSSSSLFPLRSFPSPKPFEPHPISNSRTCRGLGGGSTLLSAWAFFPLPYRPSQRWLAFPTIPEPH